MKYALAVVGLAASAYMVLGFTQSLELGIKALSVIVVFMIVLILVTNIPGLKFLSWFVSIFLGFMLLLIFVWSAMYTYSYAKQLGLIGNGSTQEISIDVLDEQGNIVQSGTVYLKIPGEQETSSKINGGTAKFLRNIFDGKTGTAIIRMERTDNADFLVHIGIDSLLFKNGTTIKFVKSEQSSSGEKIPVAKSVNILPDARFCENVKQKLTSLKLWSPPKKLTEYIFELSSSNSIVPHTTTTSLSMFTGGHLVIVVNGSSKISFPDKLLTAIDTRYGNPEAHVKLELDKQLKEQSCNLNDQDLKRILDSL